MVEPGDTVDRAASQQRVQTLCLVILSAMAIALSLHWLSPVLVPFVLAVFFVYAISPLVTLLQKYLKLPRVLALVVTFAVGLAILSVLGLLIATSLSRLEKNADRYQHRIGAIITEVSRRIEPYLEKPAKSRPQAPTDSIEPGSAPVTAPSPTAAGDQAKASPAEAPLALTLPTERIKDILLRLADSLFGILGNGAMVLIFVLFLLMGGSRKMNLSKGIWAEVQQQIRMYLIAKFFVSLATGIWTTVVLWVMGVDLALVFGVLAFLLNFIPSIGSIIGTLLPLPMMLLNPAFAWWHAVVVLGLLGGGQFFLGNILEPRLIGRSMDLHPITVLLTLIFWGMIWGVVGMFLATPITAVTKILLERFEMTRPVAWLMAGRLDQLGGGNSRQPAG